MISRRCKKQPGSAELSPELRVLFVQRTSTSTSDRSSTGGPSRHAATLVKRPGESKFFGPVVQLPGIAADNLAARESCHFLKDRVDEENLIRIVCDHDTVIQRFKNGLHLLQ